MNMFAKTVTTKAINELSATENWTELFASSAHNALLTHELSFVLQRVFDVCTHTKSTKMVHAFFDGLSAISHCVVNSNLVKAWDEHLRVDASLRMPMYNYNGDGGQITMGHLYPERTLSLNTSLTDTFAKPSKKADDNEVTQAWMRRVGGLKSVKAQSRRYDGPYDIDSLPEKTSEAHVSSPKTLK